MVEFKDLIDHDCCCCREAIKNNGTHVNMFMLNRMATWEYPSCGNVLTGERNKAVAIVCDQCLESVRANPSKIKYALKVTGEEVEYVPISSLKKI